jgi:hypothetical protein
MRGASLGPSWSAQAAASLKPGALGALTEPRPPAAKAAKGWETEDGRSEVERDKMRKGKKKKRRRMAELSTSGQQKSGASAN